jgi:fumarate hydratase subunit alpha
MIKRKIEPEKITRKLKDLILETSMCLPADVLTSLNKAVSETGNEQEKMLLDVIIKNSQIAKDCRLPLCQDTGISIFFVEQGQVEIEGEEDIKDLINKAVSSIYSQKKLRPSIISDPLNGQNTGDNTPAVIHIEHNSSDSLKIKFMAKGGGSENAGGIIALNPSDGFEGVKNYVKTLVQEKGINACPPLIIGIAIGGTIEQAALAAKKALFRKIGKRNPDATYAKREKELKNELNKLNIGTMGIGGTSTVLDVFIEPLPRHMATMIVAVSILCHSARKGEITL